MSTIYSQPFYQRGVVPASLSHQFPNGTISPTPMRVEPDVSALADPSTGMLVGQTTLQPNGVSYAFALSRIGGTSVSCPTFAGIEADAQQAAGHPLGFANPVIYQRYGTGAFRDVTDHPFGPGYLAEVRNNYTNASTKQGPLVTYLRTLGIDGEGTAALPAVRGYDDATGIGSPSRYIQSFHTLLPLASGRASRVRPRRPTRGGRNRQLRRLEVRDANPGIRCGILVRAGAYVLVCGRPFSRRL